MAICLIHHTGGCSLVDMVCSAYGMENKPKCLYCRVILSVVFYFDLDVMDWYSEISWRDISIEITGFSEIELQRVRVFNSAPLTTGKDRVKTFLFDVFQRQSGKFDLP